MREKHFAVVGGSLARNFFVFFVADFVSGCARGMLEVCSRCAWVCSRCARVSRGVLGSARVCLGVL